MRVRPRSRWQDSKVCFSSPVHIFVIKRCIFKLFYSGNLITPVKHLIYFEIKSCSWIKLLNAQTMNNSRILNVDTAKWYIKWSAFSPEQHRSSFCRMFAYLEGNLWICFEWLAWFPNISVWVMWCKNQSDQVPLTLVRVGSKRLKENVTICSCNLDLYST